MRCHFRGDRHSSIKSRRPDQREFLAKALQVAQKMPALDNSDEGVLWKNAWHWNLACVRRRPRRFNVFRCLLAFQHHREAGFGDLILVIREGRVSAETHSSGWYEHAFCDMLHLIDNWRYLSRFQLQLPTLPADQSSSSALSGQHPSS
jgi:hypothetical protein